MKNWIVIEQEHVDVRLMSDPGPRYIPGSYASGGVVRADSEREAVEKFADGREGYFVALPLPDGLEIHSTMGLVVA